MLAEQLIQRAVFAHLRSPRARGFAWHTPNGGYRRRTEAAIFNGLGVVAGIPDVLIMHAGKLYALELKAERGRLSLVQEAALEALADRGAICAVAYGLDEALAQLEAWGILRGKTSAPVRCVA
jgi:hypothetical protein